MTRFRMPILHGRHSISGLGCQSLPQLKARPDRRPGTASGQGSRYPSVVDRVIERGCGLCSRDRCSAARCNGRSDSRRINQIPGDASDQYHAEPASRLVVGRARALSVRKMAESTPVGSARSVQTILT